MSMPTWFKLVGAALFAGGLMVAVVMVTSPIETPPGPAPTSPPSPAPRPEPAETTPTTPTAPAPPEEQVDAVAVATAWLTALVTWDASDTSWADAAERAEAYQHDAAVIELATIPVFTILADEVIAHGATVTVTDIADHTTALEPEGQVVLEVTVEVDSPTVDRRPVLITADVAVAGTEVTHATVWDAVEVTP